MFKLNNYMYPLFNKNSYNNFTNWKIELMQLKMDASIKKLSILYSNNASDSIPISNMAKQYSLNQKELSSATETNDKPLKELTANNNVLDISKGSYYKFKTDSGKIVVLTSEDGTFLHTQTYYKNCGLQQIG